MSSFVEVSAMAQMDNKTHGSDRSSHESPISQPTSPEAMLYQEYMNWADDVDETLENANLPLNTTLNPPILQTGYLSTYNEGFHGTRRVRCVRFVPSISTIVEETEDELLGSAHGSSDTDADSETKWKDMKKCNHETLQLHESPTQKAIWTEPNEATSDSSGSPLVSTDTEPSSEMVQKDSHESTSDTSDRYETTTDGVAWTELNDFIDDLSDSHEPPIDAAMWSESSRENSNLPESAIESSNPEPSPYDATSIESHEPGDDQEYSNDEVFWMEMDDAISDPLGTPIEFSDAELSSQGVSNEFHESNSELSGLDEPVTNEESAQSPCPSNSNVDPRTAAQEAVDNIFADREMWLEADEGVHHFNWMGLRVYNYSATSPADSLALILATPKFPWGTASLRTQSVLSRASTYIDPVIVVLDDADEDLLELRGSELVRASTGKVFKYYSPHGRWLDDSRDSSEETTTDFGNIEHYEAADLAIGNGFVQSSLIRPYWEWMKCRNKICDTLDRVSGPPRKSTWVAKPSPLHQCETIPPPETSEPEPTEPEAPEPETPEPETPEPETPEPETPEPETPEPEQANTVKVAKRPRPKVTTCVAGAPPEEYFSFPNPLVGRRSALNAFIDKARRKVTSLFSYSKRK
ncbi:hypothetical protein N7457_004654 [Penicillium paradoxum]|uniref:uncharacterized protein n=1 Tax=Penicillium paradoxum TaxID=176176 RepID=UPI002548BBA9|nr:uncharacterized protein N7457_004654 [Penicillium paradoxum]KAJ5782880.1 hypothetical protein N7457_004654 [Penicillium paradoxum]